MSFPPLNVTGRSSFPLFLGLSPSHDSRIASASEPAFFLSEEQCPRPQDRTFLFLPGQPASHLMKPTLTQ